MTGEQVSVTEAALMLGRTVSTVLYLIERGHLPAGRTNGRWLLEAAEVERYRYEEERWISTVEAAKIIGCSVSTIRRAVANGSIEQRHHNYSRPSLCRVSVAAFSLAEEGRSRLDAALAYGRAPVADRWGPPRGVEGDPWLSTATAAVILGCSPSRVRQLCLAERLPATRHHLRWWLRRSHVEIAAASRVAGRTGGVARDE